jgi:hypothetical protein
MDCISGPLPSAAAEERPVADVMPVLVDEYVIVEAPSLFVSPDTDEVSLGEPEDSDEPPLIAPMEKLEMKLLIRPGFRVFWPVLESPSEMPDTDL